MSNSSPTSSPCPQCKGEYWIPQAPDPKCEECHGAGERFWHDEECSDDHCALAGGMNDCRGAILACQCAFTNCTNCDAVEPDPTLIDREALPF